jgi:hypothetical protein
MTRPWSLLAILIACATFVAACGRDDETVPVARKVDPALAPATAVDGRLKLFESTDEGTRSAFVDAGETSLIADGRLWEIRRAERLVGTLQISTVVPRVELTAERNRQTIAREILIGSPTRILVRDIEVSTVGTERQAMYVWYGVELVQILTVRSFDGIEPVRVLESVLAHQAKQPAWEPLPVEFSERDE